MTDSRRVVLTGHASNPVRLDQSVTVHLHRPPAGGLKLDYRIDAAAALNIPAPLPPARREGLWRTTCCELFLATAGLPGYREFNFSPSGEWAIFDFSDYRQLRPWRDDDIVPSIACRRSAEQLWLDIDLPPALCPAADTWEIGASAVLEGRDGSLGYWALAHGGPVPDFHWRGGFRLRMTSSSVTMESAS